MVTNQKSKYWEAGLFILVLQGWWLISLFASCGLCTYIRNSTKRESFATNGKSDLLAYSPRLGRHDIAKISNILLDRNVFAEIVLETRHHTTLVLSFFLNLLLITKICWVFVFFLSESNVHNNCGGRIYLECLTFINKIKYLRENNQNKFPWKKNPYEQKKKEMKKVSRCSYENWSPFFSWDLKKMSITLNKVRFLFLILQ